MIREASMSQSGWNGRLFLLDILSLGPTGGHSQGGRVGISCA